MQETDHASKKRRFQRPDVSPLAQIADFAPERLDVAFMELNLVLAGLQAITPCRTVGIAGELLLIKLLASGIQAFLLGAQLAFENAPAVAVTRPLGARIHPWKAGAAR